MAARPEVVARRRPFAPAGSAASRSWAPSLAAIFQDCAAGTLTGIVAVTSAIAYAALMFAGPLAENLTVGLGMTLAGTLILATAAMARSSIPFAAAGPDANASVVIAAAGAALVVRLPPEARLAHFLAFIALAGVLSGGVLYVFGAFRLGRTVRFVPAPVVAGFMGTIGVLVVGSAIRLCAGERLSFGDWPALAHALTGPRLLAGVGFAIVLFLVRLRDPRPYLAPLVVLAGIACTHVALAAAGVSIADAQAQGWLFRQLGVTTVDPRLVFAAPLDWGVMDDMLGYALAAAIAIMLGVLLNDTGIEAATEHEADLDHELRWHGVANIIAGLLCAAPGNVNLARTIMNYRCGARTRLAAAVIVAVVLLFFAFDRFVGYMPPFILGGMLMSLGASLAQEWLVRTRSRLSAADYALVVAIAVTGAIGGIDLAVAAGIAAACALFAVSCARVQLVRNDLTAAAHRSRLERPLQQLRVLDRVGDGIRIVVLQGFMFFGTASALVDHVRRHLAELGRGSARAVVLDFTRVTGLDAAAVFALAKVHRLATASGAALVLVGLAEDAVGALRRGGVLARGRIELFPQLDPALEWCEELALRGAGGVDADRAFADWLAEELGGVAAAAAIAPYFVRRELAAGDVLVREGDVADSLFFIEAGRISVVRRSAGGETIRLRSMMGCTVVGEMALYAGGERSSTVIADDASVVHELTQAAMTRMEAEAPALAIALHRMIVRVDAERLRFANHDLEALMP
jgi:SulP family sulfate permease